MSNKHREQFTGELLDAALAQYRQVEPRAGLEARILANLQTERQAARRFGWHWGPVLASAVVSLALFAAFNLTRHSIRTASDEVPVALAAQSSLNPPPGFDTPPPTQIRRTPANASVTVAPRLARQRRMAAPTLEPRLIAQQTRTQAASDWRIEDVKISAVALADIVIK
jgi:hypothetical protein